MEIAFFDQYGNRGKWISIMLRDGWRLDLDGKTIKDVEIIPLRKNYGSNVIFVENPSYTGPKTFTIKHQKPKSPKKYDPNWKFKDPTSAPDYWAKKLERQRLDEEQGCTLIH